MNQKRVIAALLAALPLSFAFACKPSGLEQEIQFARGSAALEDWQVRALRNWYTAAENETSPLKGIAELGIFARATAGSAQSGRTARERIENIKAAIARASNRSTPRIVERVTEGTDPAYYYDAVALYVQPKCLATNSCC